MGERIGGVEVAEGETKDFATCITQNGMQEFQYEGAFLTWTNKTIWSRIDRAFHNDFWYECIAYTRVHYKPQGLPDHTPITLSFPHYPKPKSLFQFCEMWTKDKGFKDIVKQCLAPVSYTHLRAHETDS